MEAEEEMKMFSTPGFPDSYPNSSVCLWKFTAPKDKQILLNILEASFECCCDKLEVIRQRNSQMKSLI